MHIESFMVRLVWKQNTHTHIFIYICVLGIMDLPASSREALTFSGDAGFETREGGFLECSCGEEWHAGATNKLGYFSGS
jgi:hypothetical protein